MLQDSLLAGADIVFRGEAENTGIQQLLNALEAGHQGSIITIKEKPDLNQSPLPRFDPLNLDEYEVMGVQTSRGCPFNCEFCDIVNLYGQKLATRTLIKWSPSLRFFSDWVGGGKCSLSMTISLRINHMPEAY